MDCSFHAPLSNAKVAVFFGAQLVSRVMGNVLQRVGNAVQIQRLVEDHALGSAHVVGGIAYIARLQVIRGNRGDDDGVGLIVGTRWTPLDRRPRRLEA